MEEEDFNMIPQMECDVPSSINYDVRALAAAVIGRAIRDYQSLDIVHRYHLKDYAQDAERWFIKEGPDDISIPFSYTWCCAVLGIPLYAIREKLDLLPLYTVESGANKGVRGKRRKKGMVMVRRARS